MDSDWDLQAVVRGCCTAFSSASTTTTTAPTRPLDGYYNQQKSTLCCFFPDLFNPTSDNNIEQFMTNLYNYNPLRCWNLEKPATPSTPHQSLPISAFSFCGGLQDPPERQFQVKQQSLGISRCTTTHAQGTNKIKKRKNQIKRVCQVPADGSSPDLWSWRKYGQKPIKGSPYPRGYYRCSTLKGCSARKQVERDRSDPGMLSITYTGEHSHPVPTHVNSLAGSTRHKTTTTGDNIDNRNKPMPTSPISPVTSLPLATEKMELSHETERDDTDDDNNFDVSGVAIEDDTFDGLDELVVGSLINENIFYDHDPTTSPMQRVQLTRGFQTTWPAPLQPVPAGVDF